MKRKSKIDKMIDELIDEEMYKMMGGSASDTISNLGTSALQGIQQNVLYKIPGIGTALKFIGDNAEDAVDKVFGIHSQLLPSAKFREMYGNTYNDYVNIIDKYGKDSDIAQQFRMYYPEQTTQGEYIYNDQDDPSSGLKYPMSFQELYMKLESLSPSDYKKNVKSIAKSFGYDWTDPNVINMYRNLYRDHVNLFGK